MNVQEQELLDALRAEFKDEALERLDMITSGLLSLERGGTPEESSSATEAVYRNTHNLKGEARAVNYTEIETLCQALEAVFALWRKTAVPRDQAVFDVLHRTLETIRARVAKPEATDPSGVSDQVKQLSRLSAGTGGGAGSVVSSGGSLATGRVEIDETVRMPLVRLESLMLQLEDMVAVKLIAHQHAESMREVLRRLEHWKRAGGRIAVEANEISGQVAVTPHLREWINDTLEMITSLEIMLSSQSRITDGDEGAIGRLVDSVLTESKKLLLLPFSSLLSLLPKLVRDLSRDQGKDVDLVVKGGEVEIDKRMLQELKDAVIHLVRNCVDHGIEPAERRKALGKPERGSIGVEVGLVEGGKVQLTVTDDGGGIDEAALKMAAIREGYYAESEVAQLSRDESIALMFRPSVSTRQEVTTISGRGLGMSIVKERVEKLGGRIFIETGEHKGTTFRLILPLALATFRGTFVEIAHDWFVVPSSSIECVGRVKRELITKVEERMNLTFEGRTAPFVMLADVLERPAEEATAEPYQVFVMLSGVSARCVFFGVDSVLMEDEVLVKSFTKPLSRVRNVEGAAILASGRVVPVLNVPDLIKSAFTVGGQRMIRPSVRSTLPEAHKSVLLVEDSIISRMLFKSILESAGYRVKTAVDGEDAWQVLQSADFDAVVSDVEMPRLDGFDLTMRIRGNSQMARKPVILVTARESREDRDKGRDVGANAYIVKSSFDQSDLLETLRRVV